MPPDVVRGPHTGGWRRTAALQDATGQVGAAPGADGETEARAARAPPGRAGAAGAGGSCRDGAPFRAATPLHSAVTGSGCPERRRRQSPVRMRAAGETGPRPVRAPPSGVPGMAAPSRARAALARRGRRLLTQKEAVHVEEQVGDGPRGGHGRRHLCRRVRGWGWGGRRCARARPPRGPAHARPPTPNKASLRMRTQGRLHPRALGRRAHAPRPPPGTRPRARALALDRAGLSCARAPGLFLVVAEGLQGRLG